MLRPPLPPDNSPAVPPVSRAGRAETGGAPRISRRDPRYLEFRDGETFIPIGLNLCFPRFVADPEEGVRRMIAWMRELAGHGGNFVRLWLGHAFFDVEPERAGRFDEKALDRIEAVLDAAQSLGLRVKLTLEHFRNLGAVPAAESFAGAANFSRPQYARPRGGPAASMDDFWQSPACRAAYLRKLDHLAARFADHPAIAAWELWNEINACAGKGWEAWTEAMLPELKRRFPGALTLQSLGSFCAGYTERPYRWLCGLRGNDVVQIHRYLDLGAEWPVCHQSIDLLSADAVRRIREWAPDRAVLLAEGGAVEPHHAGPSSLYEKDREGLILHDVLFAPFFAGAAGSGQCWHWDFYVARHRLWWHFGRFRRAIAGFDPVRQRPRPLFEETGRLRLHILAGESESIIWIRNKDSDWRSELLLDRCPAPVSGLSLALPEALAPVARARAYDPWSDTTTPALPVRAGSVGLPPFQRSLVLTLRHDFSDL